MPLANVPVERASLPINYFVAIPHRTRKGVAFVPIVEIERQLAKGGDARGISRVEQIPLLLKLQELSAFLVGPIGWIDRRYIETKNARGSKDTEADTGLLARSLQGRKIVKGRQPSDVRATRHPIIAD